MRQKCAQALRKVGNCQETGIKNRLSMTKQSAPLIKNYGFITKMSKNKKPAEAGFLLIA